MFCFPIKSTFCHFYTGWYITKHTLNMYLYSKLFKKECLKLSLLLHQTCHDYLIFCIENNKLHLNLKGIMQKLLLIWQLFLDMVIFLHINTPCINQFCYTCSSTFSTHWYRYDQPYVNIIYIQLQGLKAFQYVVFAWCPFEKI